jgi:hypothetical protein
MTGETPKKSNVIEMNRKKPKPTKTTEVANSHKLDDVDPDVKRDVETGEENVT